MERKQITLRIPNELYKKLSNEAERIGINVNDLINIKLYDFYLYESYRGNADRE